MRFVKTPENPFFLPSGFTRVEYLESTGTQYIDTGISPNGDTGFDLYGKDLDYTAGRTRLGSRDSMTSNNFAFVSISTNKFRFTYGTGDTSQELEYIFTQKLAKRISFSSSTKICTVEFNDGTVENSTPMTSVTPPSGNRNILLFAYDSGSGIYYTTSMKVRSFKLSQGSTLVRDFIPCIDPLGVACMYDLVGKKAYYNQGSGEFTVGRQIIPVEYLESTGTQYIDTGVREDTTCIINIQSTQTTNTTQVVIANNPDGARTKWFGTAGNTNYYSVGGSTGVSSVSATTRKECVVTFTDMYSTTSGSVSFYFNDSPQTVYSRSDVVSGQITLTNIWVGSNTNLYPSYFKLFGLKIYNTSNFLLRDFIPCKDENNVGFMFDTLSGTVYLNAGTGAFIVGGNKHNMKLRLIRDNILPTGYTQVEYLEASGTQRITTDVSVASGDNFNLIVKGAFTTLTGYSQFMGINGGAYFGLTTTGYYSVGQSTGTATGVLADTNNHIFNLNCTIGNNQTNILKIDGTSYSNVRNNSAGDVRLFDVLNSYACYFKMAGATVYKNNALVRDFIPALDPSGTPCMYDLVTRTPFYNQGTGTFITGNPVLPMVRFVKDIIPREYAAVNYIESTGTQYIDTGVLANGSFDAEYKIKTGSTNTRNFIVAGARTATQHLNFGQFEPASRNFILAYLGSWWTINNKTHLDTEYEIKIHYESGNQYAILNDETIGNASLTGTEQLDINIYLFKRNFYNPEVQEGIQPMIGRMYYFKIWNNNVLVRNFIPVVRRIDKVAGMWDTVTKQFYGNSGTNSFNYG